MKDIICGIQHLSLSDFDDHISCVLFTKGCNFNCSFCHNTELLTVDTLSNEEVFEFLNSKKNKLEAVVISGGEPTIHNELPLLIKEIKELGFLVKLDTNGTNPKMLKELVNNHLIDYVAMDIKNSFNRYNDICMAKVNIDNIKESVNFLLSNGIDYEFRTTLINEYHDMDSIKEISIDIAGANKLYLQKYTYRNTCPTNSLNEVSIDDANIYKEILSSSIKQVSLRGYK